MLCASLAGIDVAEYMPNLVKKTIVGAGHAEKAQIHAMVRVLLPKANPRTNDAADALAVALTHAQHRGARRPALVEDEDPSAGITTELEREKRQQHRLSGTGRADHDAMADIADMG